MKNTLDDRLKTGYEEYLKLPLATINNWHGNIIYTNRWYIKMGSRITAPNPHRHYTLLEFTYYCGVKEEMYNRFIK